MTDMPVFVVPYDPAWPGRFAEQREPVTALLSPWLAAPVEHVGSTSVPGLSAKPVIDVLAPVADLAEREAMVARLSAAGWRYWPDDPAGARRLWFLRPDPARRTHHLHVMPHGGAVARGLRAFRDALRADSDLAGEYARLKEELARAHPGDRNAYTNGKDAFVARVLRSAGIEGVVRERLPE